MYNFKVHTNPILICFCSILYYRDLAEHIRRYKMEKEVVKSMQKVKNSSNDDEIYLFLKKFGGKLNKEISKEFSDGNTKTIKENTKTYRKTIVNRWHVLYRLSLNKELIPYRGHNIKKKLKKESLSIFTRIKLICTKKKQS